MKSLFRIEQEGFISSENAETRYLDAARHFVCLFHFKTKFQWNAVNSVKHFDFDGSVCAGFNIFPAISIWEKQEGRQSRCHSRTGDLAPTWQTGRVGNGVGAAGAWGGTAEEGGQSWECVWWGGHRNHRWPSSGTSLCCCCPSDLEQISVTCEEAITEGPLGPLQCLLKVEAF